MPRPFEGEERKGLVAIHIVVISRKKKGGIHCQIKMCLIAV